MKPPELPDNEHKRQMAVEKYQLLDTPPEEQYDNITALVSYICETPISLISLLDRERNFFKSHLGVPFSESPREISFCGHTIISEEPVTIIEDARLDERFYDNPLVTEQKAVFYAGAPLVDSDGFKLGTLCVFDHRPRKLSKKQLEAIITLSKQVVQLFEQRYQNFKLVQFQELLLKRNEDLKKFAGIVSHDLKSPLANIISLSELLEDENKDKLNDESLQYLAYLKTSSYSLKDYIDGILEFYMAEDLLNFKQEKIDFKSLINEINNITDPDHGLILEYQNQTEQLITNKAILLQVLINLVTNSIKYNSKSETRIEISISETANFYEFSVKDNSDGIPKKHLNKIFDLFSVAGSKDKFGNKGTGIGLATVKKLIENLGGEISVSSIEGEGSNFAFTIAKKRNVQINFEA